jgi:hypothetical protein
MSDNGARQSIHRRRSEGMADLCKPLDHLPWPRNIFGEYATIRELLSGAVQPVEALGTIGDTGCRLARSAL